MQNAGMIYGYARVSTDAQDFTSQRAQLTVAGCEKVSSEKITGTTADRPQLQKLMKALAPGDVVNTRLLIASPAMQPTFSLSPAICSAPGPACVRLQSRLSIRPRILPSLSLPCWASRRSSQFSGEVGLCPSVVTRAGGYTRAARAADIFLYAADIVGRRSCGGRRRHCYNYRRHKLALPKRANSHQDQPEFHL